MRIFVIFTFIFFSLCIHLTVGGIFRRYVRKHRPAAAPRIPHHINHMLMARSRMMSGPPLIERQFRIRQRPWPMYVRRPRAPPLLYHYQSLQGPLMLQSVQSLRPSSRASRRLRYHERLDMSGSSRVPQFHHQPLSARHHLPIGISSTTRLPTSAAVVPPWRPLDYGNPIDRDPTYDYAPPAIERVRFVSEVRGRGHPTARANNRMLGMYSRPSPVVVPAPWAAKRENMAASANHIRSRHPAGVPVVPHHPHFYPPPPPPRGALPLWKILAHKQRPRRPQRPVAQVRPQQQQAVQQQPQPPRYLGQDPNHPLYHHQVFQRPSLHSQEAEVFPHIPNIVYFKPTDVSKTSYAKKTPPVKKGGSLKPGSVASAQRYSKEEIASSSEFRPVQRPSPRPTSGSKSGNKAYQFTVVGYRGPAATTPMSPVAAAPFTSTLAPVTTKRTASVLFAVKTTPETLSTTHNSVVKPLEPTESLEPGEEEAEASELQPVHVLPSSVISEDVQSPPSVVEDGREQGGLDLDFENLEDEDGQQSSDGSSGPAPVPVIPNSFNVFESLLSSFEKEFGGDVSGDEDADNLEDEILEVKDTHSNSHSLRHHQRVPVFEPAEESTLRGGLLTPAEILTTTGPSRNNFETSTSISVSVGVSSSSSSSSKFQNGKNQRKKEVEDEREVDSQSGTDGLFSNIRTVPTTTSTTARTTSTTTTPTTAKPTTTERTTTPTTTTASTSTAYPRLPTMPTYKRKPTPVYPRKSSKAGGVLAKYSSSSSSVSKEMNTAPVPNGSGEVVIITAGRSKVKEYKPQVIANQTHLLAFDKVVADGEATGSGVKESPIVLSSAADYASSPLSTSTTKSPLEDFDAMQLLHSWLNKA